MMINVFIPITAAVSLANLVIGQKTGIESARIYASTSSITAGEDFQLKCSTFGLKKRDEQVFLYLCKNGVGIDRSSTKSHDTTFTVKHASFENAGNYSCMFSRTNYSLSEVNGEADNSVLITVTDFISPAVITVDKSRVRRGADLEFRCTSEDAPDTGLLHAYLCRNQNITDVSMWNSLKKQAHFLMKSVQVDDSGTYSCVLSHRLLPAAELDKCGRNGVFLQVDDSAYPAAIAVSELGVHLGTDVDFRCTLEVPGAGVRHAYLCRNHTIIEAETWDFQKQQATFHLKGVRMDDAGSYSCGFSQRLLTGLNLETCGEHAVFIKVYKPEQISRWNENFFRILCSIGVVIVAVVVLTSSRFCHRRDVYEEKDGTTTSETISMVIYQQK